LTAREERPYVSKKRLPTTFDLFIPSQEALDGAAPWIAPASAVIGIAADPAGRSEQLSIFVVEPGDGETGPRTYADRALAAVSLFYASALPGLLSKAPTAPRDCLSLVAVMDPGMESRLTVISESDLAGWLAESEKTVPAAELEISDEWLAEHEELPPECN
jgi:hypothetical protein